jgi:lactoylglutathione lyase
MGAWRSVPLEKCIIEGNLMKYIINRIGLKNKRKSFFLMLLTLVFISGLQAKSRKKYIRPAITGITNAAFFAKDVENTRQFYTNYLGFAAHDVSKDSAGSGHSEIIIDISDRQFVEIYKEKISGGNRLFYFSVETTDAEGLRKYMASKGVDVPEKVTEEKNGNYSFFVTDPNGTVCKILQNKNINSSAKELPDKRIASRMSHVGFMVPDLEKAMTFYRDILGFHEIWRGSKDGINLNWVNLRVPEGNDYIELMLYAELPSEAEMGILNHICLEVNDVTVSSSELAKRKLPPCCSVPTLMKTGINGKRQINCYDNDGTRIEIMEARTFDGKLVPSSLAPPLKFVP